MNYFILDDNFKPIHIINSPTYEEWNTSYYDIGTFRLELSEEDYKESVIGRYVTCSRESEIGIIEGIENNANNGVNAIYGRFAEQILNEVILSRANEGTNEFLSGHPLTVCYNWIRLNLVNWLQIQPFTLHLNDWVSIKIPAAETYVSTGLGGTLWERAIAVLKPYGHTIRLSTEKDNIGNAIKSMTCYPYCGEDKSKEVIFSDDNGNINTSLYVNNNHDYRDYAVVFGPGEGYARTQVFVDKRRDKAKRPRQISIDAREIQISEDLSTITKVKEAMKNKGIEKLQEHNEEFITDVEVFDTNDIQYGRDYFLGDIVTFKIPKTDLYIQKRITATSRRSSDGATRRTLNFGEAPKSQIQKIKRGVYLWH